MVWNSLKKSEKLTTKYGQLLSYARQGPPSHFFFHFFSVEFYCHDFTVFLLIRKRDHRVHL